MIVCVWLELFWWFYRYYYSTLNDGKGEDLPLTVSDVKPEIPTT